MRKQNAPAEGPRRVTVNFTERSVRSLVLLQRLTGDSITDAVTRSLQTYAYLMQQVAQGSTVVVRDKDGTERQLEFLL